MPQFESKGVLGTYEECPGSPSESIQASTFRTTRTFLMNWSVRWHFIMWALGYPTTQTDPVTGNVFLSRTTPQGYYVPNVPGSQKPWIFPTGVESIKPEGRIQSYDEAGVASYEKARVTLSYEALTYSIKTDAQMIAEQAVDEDNFPDETTLNRYVTRFQMPTAEYLTLPFGGLRWATNSLSVPVAGSIGKIVAATEVMLIWHQVPSVPEAVNTHIGTVNDRLFPNFVDNAVRQQFQRGTLLLTSIDIKPYRWFLNQRLYDITYKFKYFQPVVTAANASEGTLGEILTFDESEDIENVPVKEFFGHNHFLRYLPGRDMVPRYQMLTHNGYRPSAPGEILLPNGTMEYKAGRTVYEYKDFSDLFRISSKDTFD